MPNVRLIVGRTAAAVSAACEAPFPNAAIPMLGADVVVDEVSARMSSTVVESRAGFVSRSSAGE